MSQTTSKATSTEGARPGKAYRTLNRDGSFNIIPIRRNGLHVTDIYHSLLSLPWGKFFALLVAEYFVVNLMFAAAYYACGATAFEGMRSSSAVERFLDCFFFSVQTFATIGYGRISPVTLAPNLLVTIEALSGFLTLSLATGLLFARFSKPTAKLRFSQVAVMNSQDGVPSLLFRVANVRSNLLSQATANVVLMINETTAEGESYRSYYDLKLEHSMTPVLALSWTVVHFIDAQSPLRGHTPESLAAANAEVLVTLSGLDDTLNQTIHARYSYIASEIRFGARFADMLSRPDGKIRIDLTKLSEVISAPDAR